MKKVYLLKTMLLLCALIVGSSSVWAEDTYTKVTSENDLVAGSSYIFVAKEGTTYYMASGTYAKRLVAVTTGFSVSSDENTVTITTAEAFVVELGGSTGAYTFKMSDNKYLGKGSANTEFASNTSTTSEINQYTWRYSGNAVFSNYKSSKTDHTDRYIGLNSETPVIAPYNNTTNYPSVVLYKKVESTASSSEFTFTMTNKAATIEIPGTSTYTGTYTTASGYEGDISYELSNNTCGATINQSTGLVTVTKEGSVIVKGIAAAEGSFSSSEDSYTLTVTDSRQDSGIAWSSNDEVRIAQGASEDDYTLPTLSNPHNLAVTYTSTNEDIAVEVDGDFIVDTSKLGSTTITASFAGDTNYKATSTSFIITVYDPSVRDGSITSPYNVADVIVFNPTSTSTAVKSNVYVKGFIIGAVDGTTGVLKSVSESNSIDTNLAIADDPTETENYCTVQLPSGDIRNALKTKNQTYNIGVAQVLVKGNIKKYCGKPGVKDLSEGSKVAEQVNITAAGMATYYTDCALDFTEFADMYAYTATAEGTNITYTRVKKVPAKTAVLLRNPSKAAATQLVPVITEGAETVSSNYLVGTLTDIPSLATNADNGGKNYILNNGSNGVGFYWANYKQVGVHRAYLNVPAEGAPFFALNFDDETTDIQNIERTINDNQYYTLDGRRVAQPTKGLYIVNGKKVVIK